MNQIKIDFDECNGCKACFKACFVNVFRWDEATDLPRVAYPEDCVECNKCELACPKECLTVVPDYDSIYWPAIV